MRKKLTNGKRVHYAWVIFGVSFLVVFFSLGFGSSTKSTFLAAVTGQMGLDRGFFSIGDSLRFVVTSLLSFFFAFFVGKIGVRRMVGAGFAVLILSMLVQANATDYWHFYVGGILLGAGLSWTTTAVIGEIVGNWFTNNKGKMMGIILAANGLGGVASENVITRVIYGMDGQIPDGEARWRTAYYVIAAIFAVVGALAFLLLRNKPSDVGLEPLGQDAAEKKKKNDASREGPDFRVVLKKPYFYTMGVCIFIAGFVLQALSTLAKPHMYDLGVPKDYVILVFSVHLLAMTLAKVLSGVCFDKFGIRPVYIVCCICVMISTGSLALMSKTSVILPWVYSVVSSFAMPLETVILPLLASGMFGKKAFRHVVGIFLSVNTLGNAVGIPTANFVFDRFGSYNGFLIVSTFAIAGVAVVAFLSMTAAMRDAKKETTGTPALEN